MTSPRGFSPGDGQLGVFSPFCGIDAADALINSTSAVHESAHGRGVILLADGSRFEGELFGAAKIGEGELVFTT